MYMLSRSTVTRVMVAAGCCTMINQIDLAQEGRVGTNTFGANRSHRWEHLTGRGCGVSVQRGQVVEGGVRLISKYIVGFALNDSLPSATQDRSSSSYEVLCSSKRGRLPIHIDCSHQHVVRHTVCITRRDANTRMCVGPPSSVLWELCTLIASQNRTQPGLHIGQSSAAVRGSPAGTWP